MEALVVAEDDEVALAVADALAVPLGDIELETELDVVCDSRAEPEGDDDMDVVWEA